MQQPSPSYRESYQAATVADAARILGVSESTIRRLVRTGRLEAERVERPQGHAWLVKVPAPATDQSGTDHHLGAATPINQPASGAMAAWVSSVLDPLVVELRMSREAIAGQAERLGYVTAERDAARAELAAEKARHSPAAARLRALASWLVVMILLATAVVILLMVPR
jgi:excisionase family DNA binding protein